MLILERKAEQSILIGDNVTVKIVEVKGKRVRILIDAPHDIRIMRTEILDKKPE